MDFQGESIFIHNNHGKVKDLSDILRIARSIGKRLLNVEKVNVKPLVYPFQNGFWVVVCRENGRSNSPIVGGKDYNQK